MRAYKLLRVRRDGSLGPLFINRRQRVPVGVWLRAEDHPTPGFAHRPGWHCCSQTRAPHISPKGKQWFVVEITGTVRYPRPEQQGGLWYVGQRMKVVRPCAPEEVN